MSVKFRWWYVSMSASASLVLALMFYLKSFVCVPVENLTCLPLFTVFGH